MSALSPPDDRLVTRAASGDGAAFEDIFERYHQPVYRYALSILRDAQDAQDALQSTMERALRSIGAQRKPGGLKAWLFGIAHNEAMDVIARRPGHVGADAFAVAPDAALDASDRERMRQLVSDLGTLPERQRSALVMRELSGLDSEEIGAALAISPSAARQSVYEARVALTMLADGRDMSCDKVQQRISAGDGRRLRGRGMRAHLRDCVICQAFTAGISSRTVDLPLLFPPLAVAAAAEALAAATGGANATGAGAPDAFSAPGASSPGGASGSGAGSGSAAAPGGSPLRDRRAAVAGVVVAAVLLLAAALGASRGSDEPPFPGAPVVDAAPAEAAPADAKRSPRPSEPAVTELRPDPVTARSVSGASVAGYTAFEPTVTTVLASAGAPGDGTGEGGSGGDGGAAGSDGPGGSLAFTGLDVLLLAAGGFGLLGLGLVMRRSSGRAPA